MDCRQIIFSGHAIRRIFERGIAVSGIREILRVGEIIADYPDDHPLPSFLILGLIDNRPIHVVVAVENETIICYVITVYEPDPTLWSDDFKKRR